MTQEIRIYNIYFYNKNPSGYPYCHEYKNLPCLILFSRFPLHLFPLYLISYSKIKEVLPTPPSPIVKESFTSFSANNIVRLKTSATIWSSSNYSVKESTAMYKVSLDNGFSQNVNTDTKCVINDLVPSLTYKGQIKAFVANGDSSV